MEEREVLRVLELTITPSDVCPLHAPLSVALRYQLLEPVPAATWELVYEADFTNKRQVVPLVATNPVNLEPGEHVFSHSVDTINTGNVKEKYLLQVGVLKLVLKGANRTENVASVNMVTQVSKDPASGVLLRNVMNPTE